MKSAFSTLGGPSLTLAEVLAVGARTGMDAVEIRLDKQDALCGYTLESIGEANPSLVHCSLLLITCFD